MSLQAALQEAAVDNLFIDLDRVAELEALGFPYSHEDVPLVDEPDEDFGTASDYRTNRAESERHNALDHIPSSSGSENLAAYLSWQLGGLDLPRDVKKACLVLIDDLDESGLLTGVSPLSGSLAANMFERALSIVQSLDPPGVAQASIEDCLLYQIPRDHPQREKLTSLISSHLDDLSRGAISPIKRSMRLDDAGLSELVSAFRELNPLPSQGFAAPSAMDRLSYDILFSIHEEGSFAIQVAGCSYNAENLIDPHYLPLATSKLLSKAEQHSLKTQHAEAMALARGINQRSATLSRLGIYLAERQRDFLVRGPAGLKPLTMQQAADDLDVSVAAISRAVKDKYAFTPFGGTPLRSFFSHSATLQIGEEGLSATALECLIARIVEAEDPAFPLNDEEIAHMVHQQCDVPIARRTITKHRSLCGIPSQTKRKALGILGAREFPS